MRFMMLMIPGVYSTPTDPNFVPPADAMEKMMKYNEALAKAGAKRIPAEKDDLVEVRQVFEMSGFPADVPAAAENEAVNAAVARK